MSLSKPHQVPRTGWKHSRQAAHSARYRLPIVEVHHRLGHPTDRRAWMGPSHGSEHASLLSCARATVNRELLSPGQGCRLRVAGFWAGQQPRVAGWVAGCRLSTVGCGLELGLRVAVCGLHPAFERGKVYLQHFCRHTGREVELCVCVLSVAMKLKIDLTPHPSRPSPLRSHPRVWTVTGGFWKWRQKPRRSRLRFGGGAGRRHSL